MKTSVNASKGFTLVELLVYIVLASIVITLASVFWFNSAVFAIQSKAKMKSSMDASQLMVYLEEDLSRIGANLDIKDSDISLDPFVYMDTNAASLDLSSFELHDEGLQDSLTYYSVIYDEDGNFDHKEVVSYYVKNDSLYRRFQKYDGSNAPSGTASTSLWADGVEEFDLKIGVAHIIDSLLGKDTLKTSDFVVGGTANPTLTESTEWLMVSGFVAGSDSKWTLANSGSEIGFNLAKGKTFQFKFVTVADDDMVSSHNPITDTLEVRLLKSDGSTIANVPAYVFYPGASGEKTERIYEFDPGVDVSGGRLVFKTKLQNIVGTPNLSMGQLTLHEVSQGKYTWYSPSDTTAAGFVDLKQFAKALQVELLVNHQANNKANSTRLKKIVGIPNNATSSN